MEDSKPIGVPFDPKVKLQRSANGNDESEGFPYQQAVGSLMLHTTQLGISNKCVESTHGEP